MPLDPSNLAILTSLALRIVFHLPLRQTEGFVGSLLCSKNPPADGQDCLFELASFRQLADLEEASSVSRRTLGPHHPNTTQFEWDLYQLLVSQSEGEAAEGVLVELAWLKAVDPEQLSADQVEIRQQLLGGEGVP